MKGLGNYCSHPRRIGQPHEPLDDRGGTPFDPMRQKDRNGIVWVYAICKHCGSGFASVETNKKEKT